MSEVKSKKLKVKNKKYSYDLLNKDLDVQECDARDADSCTIAGKQNNFLINFLII